MYGGTRRKSEIGANRPGTGGPAGAAAKPRRTAPLQRGTPARSAALRGRSKGAESHDPTAAVGEEKPYDRRGIVPPNGKEKIWNRK